MIDDGTKELDAMAKRLYQWSRRCPAETKLALEGVADLVMAHSRARYLSGGGRSKTVLNVRSGRLWRSLHKRVVVNAETIKAEVGTNVLYARIHELGGTIVPVRAGYLRFKTLDGNWVTTKKVIMPPRPFLWTALRDKKPEIPKMILRQLMTIWDKIGASGG